MEMGQRGAYRHVGSIWRFPHRLYHPTDLLPLHHTGAALIPTSLFEVSHNDSPFRRHSSIINCIRCRRLLHSALFPVHPRRFRHPCCRPGPAIHHNHHLLRHVYRWSTSRSRTLLTIIYHFRGLSNHWGIIDAHN